MDIRTAILVQARMNSTRFPGKVLKEIKLPSGKKLTILELLFERLKPFKNKCSLGILTTNSSIDDKIATYAKDNSIYCYRGSKVDLLDRYYQAATELNADQIIRITSDCPLVCSNEIFTVIEKLNSGKSFVSTSEPLPTTFPDGFDVSGFTYNSLSKAWRNSLKFSEREHVTHAFYDIDKNRIEKINLNEDHSKLRFCIDYPEDIERIQAIANTYENDQDFLNSNSDSLIKNYGTLSTNLKDHKRTFGEGWASSFEKDSKYFNKDFNNKPLPLTFTEEAWKNQIKYIPGGAQTFSKMPNAHVNGVAPKLLSKGKGGKIWDLDNNEYIDFVLGLGPIIIGHCFKEIDDAFYESARNTFVSPSLGHPLEAELAELISTLNPNHEMCRFGKNGSDATSGAVRLARGLTGKDVIACCGYHGWQDWYIGQTPRNRGIPKQVGSLTKSFKYNDIESLINLFKQENNNIACVVMEPMGAEYPEDNFLEKVKEITHQNGALLIFDEVVSGFRFSIGGAQKVLNVHPDLTCYGKAIANGYPISVITGKSEYLAEFEDVFYSFTYGGDLPSIAAAIKTINILKQTDYLEHISKLGKVFVNDFNEIASKNKFNWMKAYGHPSWPKYELNPPENCKYSSNELLTLFQQELVKQGFLTRTTPFFCAMHSFADIKNLSNAIEYSAQILNESINNNNLHEKLEGDIIQTIIRDENVKH